MYALTTVIQPQYVNRTGTFIRSPSMCNIHMAVSAILHFVYDNNSHCFTDLHKPLLQNRLQSYAHGSHKKGAPLTNCFAYIDGTVRPLCRPTRYQSICYNGHERIHAIKFQSIVTPDGMIGNMYGPIEGCRHDCALLRISGIIDQLEAADMRDPNGLPYAVYGDPAYPIRNYLLCPFKGANLTDRQQNFTR